ncbi:MAG: ADP-glyceromanno-heptose 6-epimerase [Candidatus Omnitrophota bacterium]|jgi:ADP-L-glycero-D-manno-heptose 6-epimerase
MKVIVTGGAGFIGSCLVWKLNAEGITDIIVVDEKGREKAGNLKGKKISSFMEKNAFLASLGKLDLPGRGNIVVHMGAATSTTELDASYLIENNYLYTKTLAMWALKKKTPFLYASSASTYGDGELGYSDADRVTPKLKPLNMYGYSKHAFDLWLLNNRLTDKVTGFKFFNVFGPNEYHKGAMKSVIAKTFDTIAAGETMQLFKSYKKEYADGEQQRDFIYVKDAVEIVYFFLEHLDKKGIFNVGTGKARSWNDVAHALFSSLQQRPRIEYIPMPEELKARYQYFTQANLTKLRKAGCHHRCLSLEEAVRDYAGYLKDRAYL